MKFSTFFSGIQETPWYRSFLNPVIGEIVTTGTLLDIGTGTGKLIQILTTEKDIECVGIDTSDEMILEAQKKLGKGKTKLFSVKPNTNYPFKDGTFDYITICNVLFHLNSNGVNHILNESKRLLKDGGKIIVLTPTGDGGFIALSRNYFSFRNISIYIWYYATKNRAGPWAKKEYLKYFSKSHNLKYKKKVVMNGFAQLEVITT